MNDPLLQTLMEQDRILSKSKLGPSCSKTQDKPTDPPSETNDNCSEGPLDRAKFEECGSQSSLSSGKSGASSLPANIQPIDEKDIIQNRLTVEQIKDMPKFVSYHPGEPSKVSVFFLLVFAKILFIERALALIAILDQLM